MKTIVTKGVVLSRINFQEADRILTLLTPDHGKIRLMARGVRKQKSKMAGGIELFTVGDITYLPGKGDMGTLISSRILTNYGQIVKDINRTMLGYELLKRINKVTEDTFESEYFDLIVKSLEGLNDSSLDQNFTELWFDIRLLQMTGHAPNLSTDSSGLKLEEGKNYTFSFDDMAFTPSGVGKTGARLIKFLRLAISAGQPGVLAQVETVDKIAAESHHLVRGMAKLYLYN